MNEAALFEGVGSGEDPKVSVPVTPGSNGGRLAEIDAQSRPEHWPAKVPAECVKVCELKEVNVPTEVTLPLVKALVETCVRIFKVGGNPDTVAVEKVEEEAVKVSLSASVLIMVVISVVVRVGTVIVVIRGMRDV